MDFVVKVGGSLLKHRKELERLMRKLTELSKRMDILLVPGGGLFADIIRSVDGRIHLSNKIAHRMALLAMDQYGLLLYNLVEHASKLIYDLNVNIRDLLPIILPSRLLWSDDSLEHSWSVTSDSIAAYIAHRVKAERMVLVKDVDGVFNNDPKVDRKAILFKRLSTQELFDKRFGCIDESLPKFLKKYGLTCYIVNGLYVERVVDVLDAKPTICTIITSN